MKPCYKGAGGRNFCRSHKNQSLSCRGDEVSFGIRRVSKFILSDFVSIVGLHVNLFSVDQFLQSHIQHYVLI
jgi:hypothetical protein